MNLSKEESAICDLIISPNSEYVAYKVYNQNQYNLIIIKHVDTGHTFKLHREFLPGKIRCFSPCLNYLITSRRDVYSYLYEFLLWDFRLDKIIYTLGGLPAFPSEHLSNVNISEKDIWGHVKWNNSKIICSCYDTIKVFREDEIPGLSKLNLTKLICFILKITELIDSSLFEVVYNF